MADDEPDWRAWYDAHGARLLLYARQWLPDPADAEDAVQAGFVKFWRARPAPADADVPLLFAAVRSSALDLAKAQGRRRRREGRVADAHDGAWWDADGVAEAERAAAVQAAIARLPVEQREVVTLRVWGGLTFAAVARVLDENPNTVASRYRQALVTLGSSLAEDRHEPAHP